jgi:PAS domain S-box-containing protein
MDSTNNLIQDRIQYLRENTDFISAVFDSLIGYAIIAADFDGNIIAYNEGAHQIYGYTPEEVIGSKNIEIFFPEGFIKEGKLQNIVSELVGKGRFNCEGEKLKKDGSRFPANILFTLTKDKNGQIVGFVEIVQDLTEQKQAEQASMQARDKAERVEQLERELNSLTKLSGSSGTSVTAAMYGVTSLRDASPDTFSELVKNYQEVMDLALEQQMYKVEHDIGGRLSTIAEALGFYKADPRDVVDIHTTALKEKIRSASSEKKKAYTGEGWLMVIKLMGDLASFYRNRAFSVNIPTTGKTKNGGADTHLGTSQKEAENEQV